MNNRLMFVFDIAFFTLLLLGDKFFIDYYFQTRGLMILFSLYLFLTASNKHNWAIIKKYIVPTTLLFSVGLLHLLWINLYVDHSSFSSPQILRGVSMLLQNIIFLLLSTSIFLKYDKQSLIFLCLSFILAYSICVIEGIIILGPIGLIEYSLDFSDAKLAEGNDLNTIFEVHSLGMTFPLFILLHIIIYKRFKIKQFNKLIIILLILFMLLSMKRIAVLSFFISYYFYITLSKIRNKKLLSNGLRIFVIGFSVFVVWLIYLPSFFEAAHEYGKILMGRDYLYSKIIEESNFSISYIGKGWGWVSAYMQYRNNLDNFFSGVAGLHNDILRSYIECGFWGFLFYNFIYYIHIPQKLRKISKDLFYIYLCVQFYAWITYLTDNTYQYWDFQIVVIISPFVVYKLMCKKSLHQSSCPPPKYLLTEL